MEQDLRPPRKLSPAWIGSLPGRSLGWIAQHGDSVFVLSVYIIVTVAFTWPLAANFTSFVNGNVFDVFHELWYLGFDWHSPTGPFFNLYTTSLLAPNGVPLYYEVLSPLHALIGWPVFLLFGLVPAYNFLYMFTFFVAAFSMYILVKYLTRSRAAAFVAGLAYGFAPVHAGQAIAHLNIMGSELLPLFVYFFIKMAREPSYKNGIYAGLFLVLNAMIDLHFLLLSGLIVASYYIYSALFQTRVIINKPYIIKSALMFGVAGLLGIVVYWQTFYGLVFAPAPLGAITASTLAVHLHRSPDLLQFFLPAPENPFLGQFTTNYFSNFLAFSQVRTYFGYTVLGLAIVGVAVKRKTKDVKYWGFLAIVGFLISLGPAIEINGKVTQLQGIWTYLYYIVPLFKSFRTPYRIDYLVAFGLAALAGYGCASVLERIRGGAPKVRLPRKALGAAFVVLVSLAVMVEFFAAPFPMMNATIPSFYTQVLANDHSNFTVLEVPAFAGNNVYQYYQTAYWKPQVNGQVSRTPPSSELFIESTPFIEELGRYLGIGGTPRDIINQSISEAALAPYILAQYNIKYIIVHQDLLPPNIYNRAINRITAAIGLPYYRDNLLTVFKFNPSQFNLNLNLFPQVQNVSLVSLLYGGWSTYGLVGHNSRAIDFSGGLDIYSKTSQFVQLSFKAEGVTGDYTMAVSANGQNVGTYLASSAKYQTYTTPFVWLHQGFNQVNFTSLQGCKAVSIGNAVGSSPSGGTILAPPAVACASVQFRWIAAQPLAATTS